MKLSDVVQNNQGFVFARQITETGHREYFTVKDRSEILNQDPLDEVLLTCKTFVDMDHIKLSDKDLDIFRELVTQSIEIFLNCKSYVSMFVCRSGQESVHINFDIIQCVDGNLMKRGWMQASQQRAFWLKVKNFCLKEPQLQKYAAAIDLAVYRNRATLRAPGTSKFGQNRPMVPVETFKYFIDAAETKKKQKIYENIEYKHHTEVIVREELVPSFTYFVNECAAAPEDYFTAINPEFNFLPFEAEEMEYEPKLYGAYEKEIIEKAMRKYIYYYIKVNPEFSKTFEPKRKTNFNRRWAWNSMIYKIKCFYRDTPETGLDICVDFFTKIGWNTEEDIIETETQFAEIKADFNPSVEKFISEFLEINLLVYDEVYDEKYVRPINWKHEIVALNSQMGTGKTTAIMKEKGNMLFVSYRRSLAYHILNKNPEFVCYEDYKGDFCPKFICQIDSLHKYLNWIEKYDIIFIDEAPLFFNHLLSIREKSRELWDKTFICLRKLFTRRVILASADYDYSTYENIKLLTDRPVHHILNTYKPKTDYKAYILSRGNLFKTCFNDPNPSVISYNLKKKSVEAGIILSKNYKTFCINSDTKKENEKLIKEGVGCWKNYDKVIYTPSIESGVSFDDPHFYTAYGIFASNSSNPYNFHQSLFRVRQLKNKTLYLSISGNNLKPQQYGIFLDEFKAGNLIDETILLDKLDLDNDAVDNYKYVQSNKNQLLINLMIQDRYARRNSYRIILERLKNQGIQVEVISDRVEFKFDVKDEYVENEIEKYFDEDNFYKEYFGTAFLPEDILLKKQELRELLKKYKSFENAYRHHKNKNQLENYEIFDIDQSTAEIVKIRKYIDGGATAECIKEYVEQNNKIIDVVFKKRNKYDPQKANTRYITKYVNGFLGQFDLKIKKFGNVYKIIKM